MNTVTDKLRQAILDIISTKYKKCYIGYLSVTPLSAGGWDVGIGFNNYEKPIHIAAQLEYCDFLNYFCQELSNRHLGDIHFYNGYLTEAFDPHFGQPDHHEKHTHPHILQSSEYTRLVDLLEDDL